MSANERRKTYSLLTMLAISPLLATVAVAQTPPPREQTDPSAASSPHQRDTTDTSASETPAAQSGEPSSASSPHQREVTEGGKAAMKSVTPESFTKQAAVIGKAEIELGQIALKNSKDENVRKYAERMVKDHGAADKKLKTIAAKENLQLPQALDSEHESLKTKLQAMKGEEFDREYVKAMAKGHDKAVALFESASQQPQMPAELKQFAASTLPTLEEHKEMAHSLHDKEGG
jgi:putative membrane protein